MLGGCTYHLIGVHCHQISPIAYETAEKAAFPLDTSLYQLIRILGQ